MKKLKTMKEQIVSFDTAKLAKEKRFRDLPCCIRGKNFGLTNLKSYNENGELSHRKYYCADNPFSLAPTQSLLQKWLREKYNIHITITSISQESWQYHITKIGDVLGKNYEEDFYTYEEALEVGLQESLKLIELP